ncbi:MAG: PEGA domain-containing protein [Xanthomonadales bacterium]|nr:PEGA domain-containing protein [Xanthomonadales bacterium]
MLTALALAASIAVAWFLLTARAVYIDVSPPQADVSIRGGLKLKLADYYLLREGEYLLRIEAEGYQPLSQELVIGEEQNQRYAFTLERLPGHLRVDTGPVSGARVFIEQKERAITPAVIRDLPAGEYLLRVTADRYFPYEERLLIEGLDREQTVHVSLVPAWADLTFASEPAGADVFVNDELLGQTPLTAPVLQGTHAVRVKRTGFKPWQDEIDVTANQPMRLDDIVLEPADAVVFLVSDPPRANITVNGDYRGQTPLELALNPDQDTIIRLFKQGFQAASRQMKVASGSEQRLHVNLVPELVTVEFNVTPPDAELYIDGNPAGPARQTLQLPSRPHRIEVRREGYVDYTTTVTPHAGMAQKLDLKLKSLEQARQEQIKPLITTSAGQKMKLLYPEGFTMGASRREPGRRANETIRQVVLERPFYLGLHEVTNEQYRQFDKEHSSGVAFGRSLDGARQPVVNITWEQAARYCNWLSQSESLAPFYVEKGDRIVGFNPLANGYRLPTEAEWEWAARIAADGSLLKFPWGQQLPPQKNAGNYADASVDGMLARVLAEYDDGHIVSANVGSFPAGNKGLFDMGGNVAEWTHDFYDTAIGANTRGSVDPLGPEDGEFHVIKGSSWAHGTITELRLSYRDYDVKAREDLGFRLARYLD